MSDQDTRRRAIDDVLNLICLEMLESTDLLEFKSIESKAYAIGVFSALADAGRSILLMREREVK